MKRSPVPEITWFHRVRYLKTFLVTPHRQKSTGAPTFIDLLDCGQALQWFVTIITLNHAFLVYIEGGSGLTLHLTSVSHKAWYDYTMR